MVKRRRKKWSPPDFMWSALGPIPVGIDRDIVDDETKRRLAGFASPYERRIVLDGDLVDQAMRVVLYHEWIHILLHDLGMTLKEDIEEVVVHGLATALVAQEDFAGQGD